MQALESLFRNRLVLRNGWERVSSTSFSTRCGLSKNRNSSVSLLSDLRQRINFSLNSTAKFLPLSAAQAFCSMPMSRHVFDSKVSPETESLSLESHTHESKIKLCQAGLHSSSTLKSDHDFPLSDEPSSDISEALYLDSHWLKFLHYSPFLCSECSTDNFEVELCKCTEVSDVLEVLTANAQNLTIERAGMTVAKLWQVVSQDFKNKFLYPLPPNMIVDIKQNPVLEDLLQVVENHFQELDDVKICCLMVHLHLLGLAHNTFLVHKMLWHFIPHSDALPLEVLARILLFFKNPDINYSVRAKFIPSLIKCLTNCNSKSDFVLIDQCMASSCKLLPASIAELRSKKIVDLLDVGEISSEDPKILIKVLQSIVSSESRHKYQEVLPRVCAMLEQKIDCLETNELISFSIRCSQEKLDRHLMNKLHKRIALALEEATDPVTRANLIIRFPKWAEGLQSEMVHFARSLLKNSSLREFELRVLYLLFRVRAIKDRVLLDKFWNVVLNNLEESSSRELFRDDAFARETVISRVLVRYLRFNSNLGGQYRHRNIEARIIELLQEELKGVAGLVPSRLARMSSFVVAYSDPKALSGGVVARLLDSSEQFQIQDVTFITRGLQVSQSLNSSCYYEKYVKKVLSLSHMLSACIQHLAAKCTNLDDLALLSTLSRTVDTTFSRYGMECPSAMSRSDVSRRKVSEIFSLSSPASSIQASLAPLVQMPNMSAESPPGDWTSSSFPHPDHRPNLSSPAGKVSNGKESLTQARIAPYLVRFIHHMNPKIAGVLAQNYTRSNFYNVQVLDRVLGYLYETRAHTHGLLVAQALECTFKMGHSPDLPLEAFRALAAVFAQDTTPMHGIPLMSAVLSLSFYQSLPYSLIKKIFNVNYMDFLDKEMENSFSAYYPTRLRRQLMELNRSVCIDYPEANVPWFHEEHCRDVIQTVRHQRDGFFTEVHQVLTRVLGGERLFSSKIYSPYYYLMDFSFVLNNKGKAVLQPEQPSVLQPRTPEAITPLPPGYTRHCILLMNPSYFVKRQSISDTGVVTTEPQLKGRLQLKQRHLEVLGYDVINITRHDWQSMSLGTAASKEAYLREKIFSSSS